MQCTLVNAATCTVPQVDHASWKLVQQFQNLVINNATVLTGSRILYTCDAGYKRTSATEDNKPLVCDENGVLIGELISCEGSLLLHEDNCTNTHAQRLYSKKYYHECGICLFTSETEIIEA